MENKKPRVRRFGDGGGGGHFYTARRDSIARMSEENSCLNGVYKKQLTTASLRYQLFKPSKRSSPIIFRSNPSSPYLLPSKTPTLIFLSFD